MQGIRTFFLVVSATLAFAPFPGGAVAQSLAKPIGPVILVVSGAIENTNINGEAHFDYEMLEALGFVKLTTATPWTKGTPEFEGVRPRDLLAAVAARGSYLEARALNDYKIRIPMSDFAKFEVVLALKQDGQRMRVRDKGPIWVIYRDATTEEISDKMIWQLTELRVE